MIQRLLLLALLTPGIVSANLWQHCPTINTLLLPAPNEHETSTSITADEAHQLDQYTYLLKGQVRLHDKTHELLTDEARYNKNNGDLVTTGTLFYRNGALELHGSNANINLERGDGRIEAVEFQLTDRHSRGTAAWIELHGPKVTTLYKTLYTSCNPGNDDWLLRATSVHLDQNTGVGSAYNVLLSFKHIPFFYLPYFSFPISDARKSGFLTPAISLGSASGTEVSLPYYINVGASIDATLTPRYMSLRGTMVAAELRYLRPYNQGQIDLEYLPQDRLFNNEQRGMFSYQHHGWTNSNLHSDIELNLVSDTQYFSQLSNNLSSSSISFLRQQAGFRYNGRHWDSTAIIQGYQTVDESIAESNRPYRRLPQFTLDYNAPQQPNRINWHFSSDYTKFSRSGRPSGNRIDIRPGMSLPLHTPGIFLTPKLSWYNTYYQLDEIIASGYGKEANRSLPVFSIDSGIFLEKLIKNNQWLHTLEPRLFYLHVPFRAQAHLPIFDAGLPDFTSYRLFTDNRFTGIDRVGDTQQITLSLTSRLINPENGQERLSANIGRIFYQQDRRVTLPGSNIEIDQRSELLLATQATITKSLSFTADLRWNNEQEIDRGNFRFRYRASNRKILNLSYRFNELRLGQSDISLLWPLHRQLHILSRWNYSHLNKQVLESLTGLEYQSCCWAVRLASRRFLSDTAEYLTSIYLQFELKGLTTIGRPIDAMLENGILGYQK